MSLYTEQAGGCDSGSIKDLLPTWKMGYPDDENNAAHIPQTGGITRISGGSITGTISQVGPATLTTGSLLSAQVSYALSVAGGGLFGSGVWGAYVEVSDGNSTWRTPTHSGVFGITSIGPSFTDSLSLYPMPNNDVTLEFTLYGARTAGLVTLVDWFPTYSVLAGPYTQVVTPVSTSVLPPAPPASKTISNFLSKYGYYLAGGAMLTAGAVIAVRSRRK